MTRLSASTRLDPKSTMIAVSPLSTFGNRDNSVYVYNNILWAKKSANTKILQQSVDFGKTWTDVYTFPYNVSIIIVTLDGSILVGQKSVDDIYSDPPTDLYRSGDGGKTFTSVLTIASGGFGAWSFDVYQNTVFVSGYGKYNGIYVYKSIDSGKTWVITFTHPVDGSTTVHIHKTHIDNVTPTTIYVSAGDSVPAKGVWYSLDNGSTWSVITRSHQPTWMETDETYLYMGNDLEGLISRIPKASLDNEATLETVYDATLDTRTSLAHVSFYSGRTDGLGAIYFGGVAYGLANTTHNNRNAILVASVDHGENWVAVKIYPAAANAETGAQFISKIDSNGILYVKTNNSSIVSTLVAADLHTQIAAFPNRLTYTTLNLTPNLVFNGNFEKVPPVLTAATNTVSRWIDGTAAGSTATSSAYGWAIPAGGIAGTVGVSFDSVQRHSGSYSMKLDQLISSSATSVATFMTATPRQYFSILPNTVYVLSCYIKTLTAPTNGAYIDFREFNAGGTTLVTTSSIKLTGTNDWTFITRTITTQSTTALGAILLRANVVGISTVWFDEVSFVPSITTTRTTS